MDYTANCRNSLHRYLAHTGSDSFLHFTGCSRFRLHAFNTNYPLNCLYKAQDFKQIPTQKNAPLAWQAGHLMDPFWDAS